MVEIAEPAVAHRPSKDDAAGQPAVAVSPDGIALHDAALMPLADIPVAPWRALAERAVEPNGYYLPDWELAVNASATGRTGASALNAWSEATVGAGRRGAADRSVAGHFDVARLQNPLACSGQRQSLWHAMHTAA